MAHVYTYHYSDAFEGRLVVIPARRARFAGHPGYTVLGEITNAWWSNGGTTLVQCRTPDMAYKLMTEDYENRWAHENDVPTEGWAKANFDHIDLGDKSILMDNNIAPPWFEIRDWLKNSMDGRVAVFLTLRTKRFSFESDGDYALFRMMWGY